MNRKISREETVRGSSQMDGGSNYSAQKLSLDTMDLERKKLE